MDSEQNSVPMPHCTVRYSVRLTPKADGARVMDAVAIFSEERVPDEVGQPGALIWRRLNTFSGPAGYSIREMITRGNDWKMVVRDRLGPVEWDRDEGRSGAPIERTPPPEIEAWSEDGMSESVSQLPPSR